MSLADKGWIDVQKKTFTNWVNDKLKASESQVEDLKVGLHDGVALITLLQVLAPGKKMPGKFKSKPKMDVHKRENLEIAFRFMLDVEKIPLVNIGANDIYQSNLKLILGLIWALILRYQIAGPSGDGETKESKEAKKKRKTAKKLLLSWLNSAVPGKKVTNFSSDWSDGLVLSALVDYCKPGLIPNHSSLDPSNGLENIKNAMDIAEKELGVPQVMHPEDMAVEKPDELSVMTYVSGYCKQDSPGRNSLLEWINEKIPNQPVTNFSSDWTSGQAVGALTDALSGGKFPDSEQMDGVDAFKNCQESMAAAKDLLGVETTIPPEEFAESDLDDLTRITYLTQFQHATPPSGPSLASTLKAVGHGITGDSAEKETSFLVRGPRIPKWAKLDVDVRGPTGEELPVRRQPQSSKAVSFYYTPPTAGDYTINVKLNDEAIPGSPFQVVHTPPTNVKGCFASGAGLSKARVGESAGFSVNCEQGGPGELLVEVEGPNGNIGTEIEESKPLNYSVNFTPLEPGVHGVSVTWADQQIPNSPFQCVVTDPKRCTASGRGLTRACVNEPQTFNIKADKAGPGELSVKVQDPNGSSVPVDTKDQGNGYFECTWIPKATGPHQVDVCWSDAPIAGSPFRVNVTAPADASKCRVGDLPKGHLRANKTYSFNVDISEAGSGELTAAAHGPSMPESCDVNEDQNTCTVNFTPAEVGPLKVDVSYGNAPIPESPFQFTVNDPTKVKVNKSAIESGSYQRKQPIDFKVAAQFAGEGDLTATFKGPSGDEKIEVKDQADKNYLLHICPEDGGPHVIGIQFDGDDIPGVPIRIFVEATSMADNVIVSQPMPSKIGAFLIEHPYPYKVNASGAGEGELTANSVGARTGTKPQLDIADLGNGQYTVTLNAQVPDEYMVNILWSEEPVPGSPFSISVEDKPHPEKVITDGPHYEIGSLSPITLNANTERAGAGKLTATVYGNEVGSVPAAITETDPKRFVVSFTPPKFDVFSISVLWSSENVANSPFKINIVPPDASKCIVTGPEVPANPIEGVELKVDATLAGNGTLTATAVGDNTGETDTIIKETEPNKFDVTFIPALSDYYTLEVFWSGEHVPGSPFRVNSSVADAENVVICEPPTAMLEAGQAIGICFDTSKGGRGELTASGKGNKIGEIPVSVRQRSVAKEKYDVRFTPLEPDVYVITVLWANKNVKGSPFTINLMPVDVTKIRVIGPTVYPPPKEHVELMLQTAGAGRGKVTGTCNGIESGDVKVAIKETSTDIYQLGFVPPQPDKYSLHVQYGAQSLTGSPFLINTLPSDAGKVIVTEPDTIAVAESLHYKVDATDAGNGSLYTICRGDNYGQVQMDTIEESPALYDLSFTPHHKDLYKITMEWDGDEVPGSPFLVDLRPPMADRVKVGELHVPEEAGTGEEAWIDLDCSEAGHGDILAEARGNLVGKVAVTATRTRRANYRVKFSPVQADIYHFSLAYGEDQIPGSPFYINLVPPQPNLVRYLSTSKPEGASGPVELLFDIKDAGNGQMTADVAGDTCGAVPANVEKPVPTQCKVSFVPKEQEMYSAAVLWSKRPVNGSPFRVDARPTLHPELVVCGKPIYTDINKPVTLAMDIRKAGPGVVTGVCSSDEGDTIPVSVSRGPSPDILTLAYTPPKHAIYNLSAFFEGKEVNGSPFTVNLRPITESLDMKLMENIEETIIVPEGLLGSPPDTEEPSKPSELTAYIGDPLNLVIDVEDEAKRNGVCTAIGTGNITGPVDVQATKNEDNTFTVYFNPTVPDRYTLEVMLDGEHVPNSPLVVNYLAPVDASRCRIFGLQNIPPVLQVNEPIHFGVDTRGAGQAKLHVTSDGPSQEGDPSTLDVKESDKEPGVYNITYLPTSLGQHRVHLLWGKDKIPGTPLSFEVGDVTQLPTFPFGKSVSMDFAVDRKQGDLDAFAIHEENGKKSKVKISKVSKGKFKLGFQPPEPGIYLVHVMVKKNEIPGSPYRIRVLPPPNPSGVKVEGLENGYVDQPLKFVVNARKAGGGNLLVRASGPKKVEESDLQVIPGVKEGLFDAKYTPRVPGTHYFDVSWAGTPVPGSPFSISVEEIKPEIKKPLVNTATNLIVVGQPVNVSISNLAESVNVSASCTGERSGKIDLTVDKNHNDGSRHIHFVPRHVDDYTLHIGVGHTDIEGSPFSIKAVEREVLAKDYSHPPGLTHSDVKAGEIVNLITPIEQPDIQATADGPYGLCPVDINSEMPGVVGLGFIPPLSGDYVVRGKANSDIPGSPFKIRAYGKEPDPKKVQIVEEDKEIFEKVLPFGRPARFRITTVDAGPGTLNITSRGPGKAEVKVFDNKDGTYSCEFTPKIAGKYHIDILWNDKHISGSPFLLTFKSKKNRVITGLDLENENFRIDVPHRFKLHCEDVGDGILQIVSSPSNAANIRLTPISGGNSYQCEIIPKEVGHHQIFVQYNGKHILGSPFNVQFELRGDASKCRMVENSIENEQGNTENVTFCISTEGAGRGKLTAQVENAESKERVSVTVLQTSDDRYNIDFNPSDGEEYLLTVKYDEQHIPGSPFKLVFGPPEVDAARCTAEGSGLVSCIIDRWETFVVDTKEAGNGELNVAIEGEGDTTVEPTISPLTDTKLEVKYKAPKPGDYKIFVTWGGQQIPNSPFTVTCYTPSDPNMFTIENPETEVFVGTPLTLSVVASSDPGNGELTAVAQSAQNTNITGDVTMKDERNYSCTINIPEAGRYMIHVHWNGAHIQGSPFKVKAMNPPKPHLVKAYGAGLENLVVGQEGNFTVETGEGGAGTLAVRVHGPKGAFKINMRRHPDSDRTILVRYDPTHVGKYSIDITWSETHIPGSPFSVQVDEQNS